MARQTGTGYLENTTQAPLSSSNGPWFWGMWIKLDNTSQTNKYLAYLGNAGSIQTAWIYNFVTNKTELFVYNGSGTDPRPYSQITLNNTSWNHIAMRKNASGSSSFDLFLNGTKTVGNASINFTFGAHSWSVYGAAAGGYNLTAASFAECIAIPAAPSDDQVAALAKGASGLSLGCLLKNGSYYPFIGRNSTECDIVGGRSMTTTSTNTVDHPRIFYSRPVDELATITGTTIGVLSGSSTFSLATSGSVSGVGVIAASSTLTFAGSAAVVGQGVVAGSTALTFSAAGNATGRGVIVGASAVTFGASGSASGVGVIAASSTLVVSASGTVTGSGVVAGAASITLAASAGIVGVGVVAGDGTITFAASAGIIGSGTIAGAATITFAAAVSISALMEIEGTAGISFAGAATITGVGVMVASSAITLSTAGEIAGVGVIAGTAGITFTPSAEITGLGTLEGTAAVTFGGSGDLVGIGELAAESTITLGASATIVGVGVVEGSATITFAASGSATDYDITFLLCVGAGKWASPEFYVVGAATAEFCLNIDPATAEYLVENAMSCECECDGGSLETLLANTKNTFPVTLTNKATGAAVNGKTLAWTLKTKDGVTSLGSGTATDSGAGGIYNITISQAIALQMTAGLKYRLTLTIAADGFEQRFEPTAKFN